jgi:hypothetical protein
MHLKLEEENVKMVSGGKKVVRTVRYYDPKDIRDVYIRLV